MKTKTVLIIFVFICSICVPVHAYNPYAYSCPRVIDGVSGPNFEISGATIDQDCYNNPNYYYLGTGLRPCIVCAYYAP
jgi:hypothetical protein